MKRKNEKKERENKKKKRSKKKRRERTNKKNETPKFLNCACWHAKAIKCPN